jgi:hypothetical protein
LNQIIEAYQRKTKSSFENKTKKEIFQEGDLVLRWDARREENSTHGKFDNLWFDPFKVVGVLENNTFFLHNLDDTEILGGPVNGCFLKHYFS